MELERLKVVCFLGGRWLEEEKCWGRLVGWDLGTSGVDGKEGEGEVGEGGELRRRRTWPDENEGGRWKGVRWVEVVRRIESAWGEKFMEGLAWVPSTR